MAEEISYSKLIPAFHFQVSFKNEDGKTNKFPSIPFSEVLGIGIELQTEDIKEGGGNNYVIRLPKPPKYKNLVLKRAMSASSEELIDWARKAVEDFDFDPATVVVSIKDYADHDVKTWNFMGAYPVKLSITDLSASKNEAVIDTLELAYSQFKLMKA